jgi:hypothetical protein
MSSRGVFSRMTCRFSSKITVAWMDFGMENTFLEERKEQSWPINTARKVAFFYRLLLS